MYFYDQSGIRGAVINGEEYYFAKDALGNVVEIARVSDNYMVAVYEYDAWGNYIVIDGSGKENTDPNFIGNLNPFHYRGYYYDTDLKMYYLQTRWYDPEVGRFVNLDQISYLDPETVNGLNLYAYCLNNPVMGYDPTGTFWTFLISLIATVALGAVIKGGLNAGMQSIEIALDEEKTFEDFDWNEVWGEAIEGAVEGLAYRIGGLIGAKAVGTISLGTKTLVALGGATLLLNGAAGMGSYALQNSGKGSFNVGQMFLRGMHQIESGFFNMMIGESFVYEGLWYIGSTENLTPEMKGTLLEQRILKKAFYNLINSISKFFRGI